MDLSQIAIPHSVQIYWHTTASTLDDVKNTIADKLDEDTIDDINDLIILARICSELYGSVLTDRQNERFNNNYDNCEQEFYNRLTSLINNQVFHINLQNSVSDAVVRGTRYFYRFLDIIGVNH